MLSISSKLSTLYPAENHVGYSSKGESAEDGAGGEGQKNGKLDEITLGHVAPRNYVPFTDKNDEKLSKAIVRYAWQSKFHFDF